MATFTPFNLQVNGDRVQHNETLVTSTWTNNRNNLDTHFTGSPDTIHEQKFNSPTSSAHFYLNVFQTASHLDEAEVQYAVSYGHKLGSGSPDFTNDTGSFGHSATKTIYHQYQNLVFGNEVDAQGNRKVFTFGGHTPEDIYVINLQRARLKQNLKPGSLNLTISASLPVDYDHVYNHPDAPQYDSDLDDGALANPDIYKKNLMIQLTDDSVSNNGVATMTNLGRQYNIVSGTNGINYLGASSTNINHQGESSSYGLFYPDAGIIILNPDNFTGSLGAHKNQGLSDNQDRNPERLFQAISGGAQFIVDSEEKVNSQYFFIRARNYEYNYTNNPTFVGDNGIIKYSSMIENPKVYITTIGLYNNSLDLLAVAKLSQPIAKDITKEALIRVKLDY